jgi:hypothetical protein
MRVPYYEALRFLVYTTLAYGAQGISYYVYGCAGHTGGVANPDGSPTPLYDALRTLNRDFVAIARELQPLKSVGVYHAGMVPPGGELLPEKAAFSLDPPVPTTEYKPPGPLQGTLIGIFAKPARTSTPTYALVVNLDYKSEKLVGIRGPGRLEIFDPVSCQWRSTKSRRVELTLSPGGGTLVRLRH